MSDTDLHRVANWVISRSLDGASETVRVTDKHLDLAMDELTEGGRLAERIAGFTRPGDEPGPPPGAMGPSGFPTAVTRRLG